MFSSTNASGTVQRLLACLFLCALWSVSLRAGEGVQTSVVFETGETYGYRIPALVVSNEGTVLAFAERRVGLHDHAQNDIVLKRSTDGGRSWGAEIVVHEDGRNVLINPCAVVLDSGRILLMYQWFKEGYHARPGPHMKLLDTGVTGETVSHTLVVHSDDEGRTWSHPRDVTASTKRPNVNSTATGPGIGIVLRRGKYAGRIIMPTNEGWWEGSKRFFRVFACYSDDGGSTWQTGQTAPAGSEGQGDECQIVELSDGTLLLNTRSYNGDKLRKVSRSTDGGQTWSSLVDDPALPEPECMGTILRYSWPGEGGRTRVLFANPGTQSGRNTGTVRVSYDEGASWPLAKVIEPGFYAYSCLARFPGGEIGLLYEGDDYGQIRFARFSLDWLER